MGVTHSVAKPGGGAEWEITRLEVDTGRDQSFNIERSQKSSAVVVGSAGLVRSGSD